jgi:hypothetical protein
VLAWLVYAQTVSLAQAIGGLVVLVSLAGVVWFAAPTAARRDPWAPAERVLDSTP